MAVSSLLLLNTSAFFPSAVLSGGNLLSELLFSAVVFLLFSVICFTVAVIVMNQNTSQAEQGAVIPLIYGRMTYRRLKYFWCTYRDRGISCFSVNCVVPVLFCATPVILHIGRHDVFTGDSALFMEVCALLPAYYSTDDSLT